VRDRLQFGTEADIETLAQLFQVPVSDLQAVIVMHDADDRRHRAAEEARVGKVMRHRRAEFGEVMGQHVDRQRLAVDQHAVAIEDHQCGASGAHRRDPVRMMRTRDRLMNFSPQVSPAM
jgi:hypothetical protein